MSHQILPVFLLLFFVCCQLCGQGCASKHAQLPSDTGENTNPEFLKQTGKEESVLDSKEEDKKIQITIKTIESINFVAINSVMVALAEIIEKSGGEQIYLLAKFYETKKVNEWGKTAVTKEKEENWKVQLAAKDLEKKEGTTKMKSFVVTDEKKTQYIIFYLALVKKANHLHFLLILMAIL